MSMARHVSANVGRAALALIAVFATSTCRMGEYGQDAVRLPIAVVRHDVGELAHNATRIRIRGVVTYCDDELKLLFVQDWSGAIRVNWQGRDQPKYQDSVEVEGTMSGVSAEPVLVASGLNQIGNGAAAPPLAAPMDQLSSGKFDAQWVEVKGVVHSSLIERSGRLALEVVSGNQRFRVRVLTYPGIDVLSLVDSVIRVRGVLQTSTDLDGRALLMQLWVPNFLNIAIEDKARDAALLPITPLVRTAQHNGSLERRLHFRGLVKLSADAHELLINDGTATLPLTMSSFSGTDVSGTLDIVGFPKTDRTGAKIEDAVLLRYAAPATRDEGRGP